MTRPLKIDKSLRERRRIIRLLDFLKRDDLTGDQMERIGRRLQKSGKRALSPLVRKLWQEKNGTAIYRYTCMLDFFDDSNWLDQLIQITLRRKDLEEDGRLALLDALQESGIDVTAPPFAGMTGYGASSIKGFVSDFLKDGVRGQVRFIDLFLDAADDVREQMIRSLSETSGSEAVELLEILTSFERSEVVREAVTALGRVKSGYALSALQKAAGHYEGETAELIQRSIRRLSFLGILVPEELPYTIPEALPFHSVQVGPIDIYGSRTIWFSWLLADSSYAALVLLIGESDGVINALSYRMKDEKVYDGILREVASGELLESVDPGYALALLRDGFYRSREHGYYLPPDLYVDMRLFARDALKPEAYIPRFNLAHLAGIVERIPGYVACCNELLDHPALEGWLFSEPAVYDAAERLTALEKKHDGAEAIPESDIEAELTGFCNEMVSPRRAEIVKRLLLTADYMQHTGSDEKTVQHTLATALSLVGGFLSETNHPFIRRLILDSIETARQAIAEGYDMRLEEGFDDEE
jgi:hypothetical protein